MTHPSCSCLSLVPLFLCMLLSFSFFFFFLLVSTVFLLIFINNAYFSHNFVSFRHSFCPCTFPHTYFGFCRPFWVCAYFLLILKNSRFIDKCVCFLLSLPYFSVPAQRSLTNLASSGLTSLVFTNGWTPLSYQHVVIAALLLQLRTELGGKKSP